MFPSDISVQHMGQYSQRKSEDLWVGILGRVSTTKSPVASGSSPVGCQQIMSTLSKRDVPIPAGLRDGFSGLLFSGLTRTMHTPSALQIGRVLFLPLARWWQPSLVVHQLRNLAGSLVGCSWLRLSCRFTRLRAQQTHLSDVTHGEEANVVEGLWHLRASATCHGPA